MSKLTAAKVTLSTGKVVILREMQISDTEVAAQAAAPRSNGDSNLLQILMQKELIKMMILEVDGSKLSAVEREDINGIFKMGEYSQLLKVIAKMSGSDDMGKEVKIEVVAS